LPCPELTCCSDRIVIPPSLPADRRGPGGHQRAHPGAPALLQLHRQPRLHPRRRALLRKAGAPSICAVSNVLFRGVVYNTFASYIAALCWTMLFWRCVCVLLASIQLLTCYTSLLPCLSTITGRAVLHADQDDHLELGLQARRRQAVHVHAHPGQHPVKRSRVAGCLGKCMVRLTGWAGSGVVCIAIYRCIEHVCWFAVAAVSICSR
jgi:hypothetical protein